MLRMWMPRLATQNGTTRKPSFFQPNRILKTQWSPFVTKKPTLQRSSSTSPESELKLNAFRHESMLPTGRQAFSIYFHQANSTNNSYRFEVSAPEHRRFQDVWVKVYRWLKYPTNPAWSGGIPRELAIKACVRASEMTLIRLLEETNAEIISVSKSGADDFETETEEQSEPPTFGILDVGGYLTELRAELLRDEPGGCLKFKGPNDLRADLGDEVKLRLCERNAANRFTADNIPALLGYREPDEHGWMDRWSFERDEPREEE